MRSQTLRVNPLQHAPVEAAMRADAVLEGGDVGGYAAWQRVVKAVEELLRAKPVEGELVS